jgi:hypothetical protein
MAIFYFSMSVTFLKQEASDSSGTIFISDSIRSKVSKLVSQDNNEEQIKELEIFNLNKTSSTFFYLL